MKLHHFFRSGTSHRLRIALNLKNLDYTCIPVNLRTEQHLSPAYKAIHPQGLVPALECGETTYIQTPAIIEWLEERYPTPPLLPADADERARVRAVAALVGCDIHPLNNRRVLEYLRNTFASDEAAVTAWCATWIGDGFDALERLLTQEPTRGRFSFGDAPTLADVYLVPQVESARRFQIDLARWPRIAEIDAACEELDAFRRAAPAAQADAV